MSKIEEVFSDDKRVQEALIHAAHDAWQRHRSVGHPVAEWREGDITWCDAHDFPEPGSNTHQHDQQVAELTRELNQLPADKLLMAAAYIRQLRDS